MKDMIRLTDMTRDEMVAWAVARGLPAYRGRQLYAAVFRRLVTSLDEMTDLPRELRARLADEVALAPMVVQLQQRHDEAKTEKALFRMDDGALIEGVLMDYPAERG